MKIPIHCSHTEVCPIERLTPHPRNPNRHPEKQIELLAEIIKRQGWRAPITVSNRNGFVIKGHARLMAAIKLGLKEVPVDLQEYASEKEEQQDLIADNRIAELAHRDTDTLTALLTDLQSQGDIELTGYNDEDLSEMLGRIVEPPKDGSGEEQLSRAKALQKKWKTKPGQLWTCGAHRILCGDSTDPKNWKRLMQGDKAQLVFTDPPYGVAYQDSAGNEIKNDKLKQDALAAMLRGALRCAVHHSKDDAAFYIWHASSTRRDFEFAMDQVGLMERQYITWVKDGFTLGRADYHWQTEPCFYAEKAGHRAKWCGDRTQATVWKVQNCGQDGENVVDMTNGLLITDGHKASLFVRPEAPKAGKFRHMRLSERDGLLIADPSNGTAWMISRDPRKEYLHPTQKPAELAKIAIANSTEMGDVVADPFSGSGSTLMACERLERRARAVDLAPEYVAVALERWSKSTDGKPELVKP